MSASRISAAGLIMAFALAGGTVAPAVATPDDPTVSRSERPRPAAPAGDPRGLSQSEVERPEQAVTPDVGPLNRAHNPNF